MERFVKFAGNHGTWGESGIASLLQIGEEVYLVKVEEVFLHHGVTSGSCSLYNYGDKVLYFQTMGDNYGATEDELMQFYFQTSINIDKENKKLLLHKKGREMVVDENYTGRIINVDETTTFLFKYGVFEKVCE